MPTAFNVPAFAAVARSWTGLLTTPLDTISSSLFGDTFCIEGHRHTGWVMTVIPDIDLGAHDLFPNAVIHPGSTIQDRLCAHAVQNSAC